MSPCNSYRSKIEHPSAAARGDLRIVEENPAARNGPKIALRVTDSDMRTWVFATSAIAVAALTLFRRWRRRQSGEAVLRATGPVSDEWLSQARGQRDERWDA